MIQPDEYIVLSANRLPQKLMLNHIFVVHLKMTIWLVVWNMFYFSIYWEE